MEKEKNKNIISTVAVHFSICDPMFGLAKLMICDVFVCLFTFYIVGWHEFNWICRQFLLFVLLDQHYLLFDISTLHKHCQLMMIITFQIDFMAGKIQLTIVYLSKCLVLATWTPISVMLSIFVGETILFNTKRRFDWSNQVEVPFEVKASMLKTYVPTKTTKTIHHSFYLSN